MFAQLFGYYLLDKNIISTDQLNEALVNKNIYKERLGSRAFYSPTIKYSS